MEKPGLTGSQIRAARALLRWSSAELAEAAGIGVATIRRAEAKDGQVAMIRANVAAVERALAKAGVELIRENYGGVGVRFRRKQERRKRRATPD